MSRWIESVTCCIGLVGIFSAESPLTTSPLSSVEASFEGFVPWAEARYQLYGASVAQFSAKTNEVGAAECGDARNLPYGGHLEKGRVVPFKIRDSYNLRNRMRGIPPANMSPKRQVSVIGRGVGPTVPHRHIPFVSSSTQAPPPTSISTTSLANGPSLFVSMSDRASCRTCLDDVGRCVSSGSGSVEQNGSSISLMPKYWVHGNAPTVIRGT